MTDERINVPEELDFSDDELNQLAESDKKYRTDCWFQGIVVEASTAVSKNPERMGLMFPLVFHLLEEENVGNSGDPSKKVRLYLNLPKDQLPPPASSTEAAEREVRNTTKRDMLMENLSALLGPKEIPELPRQFRGKRMRSDGTEMTEEEFNNLRVPTRKKGLAFCSQAWTNKGKDFLDCAPYLKLKYEDGSDYPSIDKMVSALPAGESFTPASMAFASVRSVCSTPTVTEPAEPAKPAKTKKSNRKGKK